MIRRTFLKGVAGIAATALTSGLVQAAHSHKAGGLTHLRDSLVSPARWKRPSTIEIAHTASAENIANQMVYYTGNDNWTSPMSHVYYIDHSGAAILLKEEKR